MEKYIEIGLNFNVLCLLCKSITMMFGVDAFFFNSVPFNFQASGAYQL